MSEEEKIYEPYEMKLDELRIELEERIEKLEQKLENQKTIVNGRASIIREFGERMEELKNLIRGIPLMNDNIKSIWEELKELDSHENHIAILTSQWKLLREVLQELYDTFPTNIEWETDQQYREKLDDWRVHFGMLLKKLEGETELAREEVETFKSKAPSADYSKPDQPIDISVCHNCKNLVPPPIGDCLKHIESGSKTGEYPKCFHLTKNKKHKDYFESDDDENPLKECAICLKTLTEGLFEIYSCPDCATILLQPHKGYKLVAKDDLKFLIYSDCDTSKEREEWKRIEKKYEKELERYEQDADMDRR